MTATVATAPTTVVLTLVDTLGPGLSFGTVTAPGAFTCSGTLSCTLPAGTAPGSYPLVYTATVDAAATGTVRNAVVATGGSDDPQNPPVCTTCTTEHTVGAPTITVVKSSAPAAGSEVAPGDTLAYTLTATIADSATVDVLSLVDTLGEGLTFGVVTSPGAFTCSNTLTCTLPAGTLPGAYAVTYTATVDADATGAVRNAVVATGGTGDPQNPPTCTTCTIEHPVVAPTINVVKSSSPAGGTEVAPGETLTYTLTATIAESATVETLSLVDTLGEGLTFGTVTSPGAFTCTGTLTCTLPAGTLPGAYAVTYTATVDADATGTVRNAVVATGGTGDPQNPPVCTTCTVEHEVVAPSITVLKSSVPAPGTEVAPGDTLTYTLTATVDNSATTEVLSLVDTLGEGLTFGTVTSPGAFTCTGTLTCTLPAGTLPGAYAVTYTATVDADATGTVRNAVLATGGTDDPQNPPVCTTCTVEHEVIAPSITVLKMHHVDDQR